MKQQTLYYSKRFLQGCFNPLGFKLGRIFRFKSEEDLSKTNFKLQSISKSENIDYRSDLQHIDYSFVGFCKYQKENISIVLRLIQSRNNSDAISFQLLQVIECQRWSADLQNNLFNNQEEFEVPCDGHGNVFDVPRKYWRVNETRHPHSFNVSILSKCQKTSVRFSDCVEKVFWDFHRITQDFDGLEKKEFLNLELVHNSKICTTLHGHETCVEEIEQIK